MFFIAVAAPLFGVDYLSEAQALHQAFGEGAQLERIELQPTAEDAKTVLARARSTARGKLGSVHIGRRDGALLGVAYIDHVIGRTEFITWLCVINPQGRISQMAVMSYREPIGGEINNQAWLNQFVNLGPEDTLRRGLPITPIAGATLSVDAICERARFLLDLHDVVTRPLIPANATIAPPDGERAFPIGTAILAIRINPPGDFNAICEAAIEAAKKESLICNQWDPESEIAALNRSGTGIVSEQLAACLEQVAQFYDLTDHRFDPTIGPLILRWQAAAESGIAPTTEELATLREGIGFHRVRRLPTNLIELPSGVQLDLGGIAKGRILDVAAETLKKSLPPGHIADLDFGSSSRRIVGEGSPISVAIRDPLDPQRVLTTVTLTPGQSLGVASSSGRLFQVGTTSHSHLIDPMTGISAPLGRLAIVIAPDATTADALDTAFCLVSVERALAIADSLDGVATLVWDGTTLFPSTRWPH